MKWHFALVALSLNVVIGTVSLAQTLQDDAALKRNLSSIPIQEALGIPSDVCKLRTPIALKGYDARVIGDDFAARDTFYTTFCDYAETMRAALTAGAISNISRFRVWRFPTLQVPVAGFLVPGFDGETACTFKLSDGRLTFAGTYIVDSQLVGTRFDPAREAKHRDDWMALRNCLSLTGYYKGEAARGFEPSCAGGAQLQCALFMKSVREQLRKCWKAPSSPDDMPPKRARIALHFDAQGKLEEQPIILAQSGRSDSQRASYQHCPHASHTWSLPIS